MNPLIASTLVIAIIALLSSCKKDDNDNDVNRIKTAEPKVLPGYFENKTQKKVYINFITYKEADYGNGYLIAVTEKQIVVAPMQTVYLNKGELTEGKTYDIDWYTEDYMQTNWGQSSNGRDTKFKYIFNSQDTFKMDARPNLRRLVCCSGNGMVTVWHAVDAFRNGKSVWNELTDNERKVVLRINWNYSLRDSSFNTTSDYFSGHGSSFVMKETDNLHIFIDGRSTVRTHLAPLEFPSAQSTDTVFYNNVFIFEASGKPLPNYQAGEDLYYMMVKKEVRYSLAD